MAKEDDVEAIDPSNVRVRPLEQRTPAWVTPALVFTTAIAITALVVSGLAYAGLKDDDDDMSMSPPPASAWTPFSPDPAHLTWTTTKKGSVSRTNNLKYVKKTGQLTVPLDVDDANSPDIAIEVQYMRFAVTDGGRWKAGTRRVARWFSTRVAPGAPPGGP